jgi:hypothetical protein
MVSFERGELLRLYDTLSVPAFCLLVLLRDLHPGTATFEITDQLNEERLHIRNERFGEARRELLDAGLVVRVRHGSGWLGPAQYRWPR